MSTRHDSPAEDRKSATGPSRFARVVAIVVVVALVLVTVIPLLLRARRPAPPGPPSTPPRIIAAWENPPPTHDPVAAPLCCRLLQ